MAAGLFFLSRMMGANMAVAMKEYQNALEDMNNEAVEYVRGIPVVKTFQQSVFSFRSFHGSIPVSYTHLNADSDFFTIRRIIYFSVSFAGIYESSGTSGRNYHCLLYTS